MECAHNVLRILRRESRMAWEEALVSHSPFHYHWVGTEETGLWYKSIRSGLCCAKVGFEGMYSIWHEVCYIHVIGFHGSRIFVSLALNRFPKEPHGSGMTGDTGYFARMGMVSGVSGGKSLHPHTRSKLERRLCIRHSLRHCGPGEDHLKLY